MRRRPFHRWLKRARPQTGAQMAEHSDALKPTITIYDYLDDRIEERTVDDIEKVIPYKEKSSPTWIDLSGDHPIPTLQRLGEIFGIHALTLEDIVNPDQRPKVEEFDHYMYIVVQKPRMSPDKRVQVEQVSVVLTPTTVVSIHERVPGPFSPIRARMHHERARIRRLGSDYLAYVVVDAIVDEYFFTLERFEDRIEEVDKELASQARSEIIEEIHSMRQEIIVLRKSVWPLREVIATLSKTESPLFDEGIKVYLKDLQDHIFQIVELFEVFRDMIGGMLDIYLSTMSHHMNQIMKTLTMVASIFIPLTLISGIYGMNFDYMPELKWKYGYPAVIGLMALVAAGMIAWFKRRRWI